MSSFVPCTARPSLALPLHLPMAVLGSLIPSLLLPPLLYEMALLVLSAATQFTQQTKTHQTHGSKPGLCHMCVVQRANGGQKTACKSPLPPPPIPLWILGIGLRSSALAANGYLLTHPAGLQRLLLVCLTLSVEGEIPSQWLITIAAQVFLCSSELCVWPLLTLS